MAEIHIPQLEGERIRYNDDTWEFTGELAIKQNGEVIEATARKPDRVRGNSGLLRFRLDDQPASINPGNPGVVDVELERDGTATVLRLIRPNASDRYTISSLRYD